MTYPTDHLFVYGTLRPPFSNPFARYLHRWSRYVGEGHFPGLLYDLGSYPGAVYSENQDNQVYGAIYDISAHRTGVLAFLDEYEGIGSIPALADEYVRVIVPTTCAGRLLNAWVYLYNLDLTGKHIIESGDYVRHQQSSR